MIILAAGGFVCIVLFLFLFFAPKSRDHADFSCGSDPHWGDR